MCYLKCGSILQYVHFMRINACSLIGSKRVLWYAVYKTDMLSAFSRYSVLIRRGAIFLSIKLYLVIEST